jgi:hypothetical protein
MVVERNGAGRLGFETVTVGTTSHDRGDNVWSDKSM